MDKFKCLFLLFLIYASVKSYRVTLNVFSGTENPSWSITNEQFDTFANKYFLEPPKFRPSFLVLGYRGFVVTDETNQGTRIVVNTSQSAEVYLLHTNPNLDVEVYQYVIREINRKYIDSNSDAICKRDEERCGFSSDGAIVYGGCCQNSFCECDAEKTECKCKSELQVVVEKVDCDSVPLKGPDTPIKYDPKTDLNGCYIEKQYDNNCYNYSTDVLTNTFAQPGRGTEHKWKLNNCQDMTQAAISDGLVYVGTEVPKSLPQTGHYVALMIWPNQNFHWIRQDSNLYWSHKPGGTAVKNTDNNGKLITDPSKQDFSPWSQYCGIFLVHPPSITIN